MTFNSWGLSCSVDLYGCNPETIRSKEKIEQYARELVDLIDMKAYGPPQVVHFGEDDRVAGFTLVQLIETSMISGHFANASNAAYLDIFSCKEYDPQVAADFSKKFFQANEVILKSTHRR